MFDPNRTLIIGEVAQSHEGSLDLAHAFIDAIATTHATAVKFQTHLADAESSPGEPFRVVFSKKYKTRYDYWKGMEFSFEEWSGLKKHAEEKGLLFLSTPFSIEAIELLEKLNVSAFKVGSGETSQTWFIEALAKTKKPVILSSGMVSWDELDQSVNILKKSKTELAVLECTTAYPCPPEKIGVPLIPEMKRRYQCPVGLSDHSGTIFPSLAAVTLGASILEVHVTLSPYLPGPDVRSSVTVEELKELVQGVRFIETMMKAPHLKENRPQEMAEMRKIFGRSAFTRSEVKSGQILTPEVIQYKKPGLGLNWKDLEPYFGKAKFKTSLQANQMLKKEDLE